MRTHEIAGARLYGCEMASSIELKLHPRLMKVHRTRDETRKRHIGRSIRRLLHQDVVRRRAAFAERSRSLRHAELGLDIAYRGHTGLKLADLALTLKGFFDEVAKRKNSTGRPQIKVDR